MKYEEQRTAFINSSLNEINSICDDVYESLMDKDYEYSKIKLKELSELTNGLLNSITNEI